MKRTALILAVLFISIGAFSQVEIIKDSTITLKDSTIVYKIRIATTKIDTSGYIFVIESEIDSGIADLEENIAGQSNSINSDISFHNTALKRKNPRKLSEQKINTKKIKLAKDIDSLDKLKEIKKLFKK